MLSVEKDAIPALAFTVVVPDKTPPDGSVPIAIVTIPVKPVAVFPNASRAVTWTAGVIMAPAVVVVGCTVKKSAAAAAGVMLNDPLTADVNPLAEAVSV